MANKTNKSPVSAFKLFSESLNLVKKNLKVFSILLMLPALTSLGSVIRTHQQKESIKFLNPNVLSSTEPAYAIIGIISAGLIVFVILALLAIFIQSMLTCLELEVAKGKKPSLNEVWKVGKKYWLRLFGLVLVISLYIVGGAIIGALTLLILQNIVGEILGFGLIIASVIFVLTHYFFAPYAMVDKDLTIFGAMETSASLSKYNIFAVLSVLGVMILLSFSSIIPLIGPIISFVLGAAYSVAPALRYIELKKLSA